LTIFEFQGNKLLAGATNLDARHSNFNRVFGGQSIVDRRVDVNAVIVVENVAVVIKNVERTSSRERHREPVERTPSRERRREPVERTPSRERRRENVVENVSIYEMIVCGTIIICCVVVVHALRVVLR
jgi:hypothetical protein